jgi:hypothetical protein
MAVHRSPVHGLGQFALTGAEHGLRKRQGRQCGISVGAGSNPILEENKRQTSLLQSNNQNLAKGMMSPVMAEFAPSY